MLSAFRKIQQHASPYVQTHTLRLLCLIPPPLDTTSCCPKVLLSDRGKPQQQAHYTTKDIHIQYKKIQAKCILAGRPNSFSHHRKTMKCEIQYFYNSQSTTDRNLSRHLMPLTDHVSCQFLRDYWKQLKIKLLLSTEQAPYLLYFTNYSVVFFFLCS